MKNKTGECRVVLSVQDKEGRVTLKATVSEYEAKSLSELLVRLTEPSRVNFDRVTGSRVL